MKPKILSFHYTLTVGDGRILDSSKGGEPMRLLTGGQRTIPALEQALLGIQTGEKKQVKIPAAEAYGPRDPRKILEVPRAHLANDGKVAVGERFRPTDDPQAPPLMVTQVTETHATLDANHPLAGVDLTFDIEMTDRREATPEEIAHGHAHGECCGHAHAHEHAHESPHSHGGCGCCGHGH
ncbi:MAG: peptidylprolyl isomerase [Verrucomicrobiae bacterium]|nr:peptidylprolyl isomerase [Verrucomicrobiae bacterium]